MMPKWIHDRARHLLAKNPDMDKGQAFAIATQQSHKMGKTPKGYGTSEGKSKAKAKYDKPKKSYVSSPNPGGLETPELDKDPKRVWKGDRFVEKKASYDERRLVIPHAFFEELRKLGGTEKSAFQLSQYSGDLGPGGRLIYASGIPPFRKPQLKTSGPPSEKEETKESSKKLRKVVDALSTPFDSTNYKPIPGEVKKVRVPWHSEPQEVWEKGRPGRSAELLVPKKKSEGLLGRTGELLSGSRLNQLQQGSDHWANRSEQVFNRHYGGGLIDDVLDPNASVGRLRSKVRDFETGKEKSDKIRRLAQDFESQAKGEANRVAATRVGAAGAVVGARALSTKKSGKKKRSGKRKAAAVISAKSQLSSAQKVGKPKTTTPPGPSIAQQSKPTGFGTPLAGAKKGNNII